MNNFVKMDVLELLGLLAKYTTRYTQLLAGTGNKTEREKVQSSILQIQAELERRKMGKIK